MAEPMPSNTGGARLGLIVGGIVVLAVVAAVIVDAVRPAALLDPDSPEGAVQSFLIAIDDERYGDAYAFLSEPAQAQCDEADLAVDQQSMSRVVVEDVNVFDTGTIVILNATVLEGDPFDPYRYDTTLEFSLIQEGGSYRIDRLPYPYFCRVI